MSGIAELLANLGYAVSRLGREAVGGDRPAGDARRDGARSGHAAANVGDADVVVFSSAVRPDNPELVEARARAASR